MIMIAVLFVLPHILRSSHTSRPSQLGFVRSFAAVPAYTHEGSHPMSDTTALGSDESYCGRLAYHRYTRVEHYTRRFVDCDLPASSGETQTTYNTGLKNLTGILDVNTVSNKTNLQIDTKSLV